MLMLHHVPAVATTWMNHERKKMESWEKPDERIISFMKELKSLLEKYKIEITATDEWEGYSECGEDFQICIESETNAYSVGAWIRADNIEDFLKEYESEET